MLLTTSLACIESRTGEDACCAYITFRDAYSLETAVLLSGAVIADQSVCICRWGTYLDDFNPWNVHSGAENDAYTSTHDSHMNQFVSTPGEAITVAQDVVKTMIAKGYELSRDALTKAKAFDESNHVSASAAAKVAEVSHRIGLTDKVYYGISAVKSVDERYHVSEVTKTAAVYTGRTAATAAKAVVNSSYFASGALWVSGVLDRASKYAADLANKNSKT
ncbi:RNA splicing factor [Lithospermum erythrorhizon]|uniref:RNA splicing factor n=1 Tax=Lithospermum erythrorhizon TaxID=34254 RepID=A0AAV3QL89_LITER